MSWFHNVSGAVAEQMLKASHVSPGTYIVRPSTDSSGASVSTYALSVKENKENVCHIKIIHEDDQFQLYGRSEQFATINDLINTYVENPKMLKLKEGSSDNSGGFLQLTEPYAAGNDSDIKLEKWFHGQIDGYAAQQLLKDYGKSGSFLVRESHSTPGAYVLVVKSAEDDVRNIKINKGKSNYDIGCGEKFSSVSELVSHYLQKPIIIKQSNGEVSHPAGPVLLQHGLPSTRVHAKNFVKKFSEMARSPETLQVEFENLQIRKPGRNKAYQFTAGLKPENVNKNRSKQILPFDSNRVLLPNSESDYINASYVTVELEQYNFKQRYILTQTPLKDTIDDFWKMIWYNNVKVIVMLTERPKRIPMIDYWDTQNKNSPFFIKLQKQSNYCYPADFAEQTGQLNNPSSTSRAVDWVSSVLEVTKKNTNHSETRKIYHFKFTSWDTYPPSPDVFVEFVEKVRAVGQSALNNNTINKPTTGEYAHPSSRSNSSPIVVHDLMGIGRAGVFIAVDSLVAYTSQTSMRCNIDIAKLVLDLRAQRANTVQLSGQYEFIYRCVFCHLARLETILDTRRQASAKGHDYTNVGAERGMYPKQSTSSASLPPNVPQVASFYPQNPTRPISSGLASH